MAGWLGFSRCKRSQYLVPLLSFFIGVCLTLELSSWSGKQKRDVPLTPRLEVKAGVALSPSDPPPALFSPPLPLPSAKKSAVLVTERKEKGETISETETRLDTSDTDKDEDEDEDEDESFFSPSELSSVGVADTAEPETERLRESSPTKHSGVFRVATKVSSQQTWLNLTVSVSLHEEGEASLEEEGVEEEVEEVDSLASLQVQLGLAKEQEEEHKTKGVVLMRPIIRQSEASQASSSEASIGSSALDGGSLEKGENEHNEGKNKDQHGEPKEGGGGEGGGGGGPPPMLEGEGLAMSHLAKPMPLEVRKGDSLKCNGLSLDDVAVAVLHNIESPNASRRYESFRAAWIRHFKNKLLYVKHREGSIGSDYLNILTKLKKKFPKKKWYLMVHDDTFVYSYNLLCYLANYNKNQPMILGSTHCRGPNFTCKTGGILGSSGGQGAAGGGGGGGGGQGQQDSWLGWTNGGAGIVISSKAAHKLNVKSCMKYYTNKKHWDYQIAAADVIFSCCGKDSNLQKIHNPGFVNGRPGFQECQCQKRGQPLCTLKGLDIPRAPRGSRGSQLISWQDPLLHRRMTYHHVSSHWMSHLFKMEYEALGHKYKRSSVYDLNHAKIIHVKGKPKSLR